MRCKWNYKTRRDVPWGDEYLSWNYGEYGWGRAHIGIRCLYDSCGLFHSKKIFCFRFGRIWKAISPSCNVSWQIMIYYEGYAERDVRAEK